MNENLKLLSFGFFEILKKKLRRIRDEKSYILYPNNPRHDDQYVVEFPKSGITWLLTLITNINLLESNDKVNVTFYNLHQYVPDIHKSKDIHSEPLWNFPKNRFIKSHDMYNKNYNFVIYIIRDPYKVMNSYYIFTKQLGWYSGTFEEFVKNPNLGIKAWISHTESWLEKKVSSQRIHLIKYEDLLDNPFEVMKNLYINLGLKVDDENIQEAVLLSNIENMKKTEDLYTINSSIMSKMKHGFVGKGKIFFEKNMNDEIKNYIQENLKNSNIYKIYYGDVK